MLKQSVETESGAGGRCGSRSEGSDLRAEFVGCVKSLRLESAVEDEIAVALTQSHRSPERY